MRRALILGCNGILGKEMVSKLRLRDSWHIIGADIACGTQVKREDIEFLPMNTGSVGWADEITQIAESVPDLDLVVLRFRSSTSPCLTQTRRLTLQEAGLGEMSRRRRRWPTWRKCGE